MLRGFGAHACAQAFQRNGPPDDCLVRARRNLGLVLCRSPLFRSDAGGPAEKTLATCRISRPADRPMTEHLRKMMLPARPHRPVRGRLQIFAKSVHHVAL